MTPEYRPHNYAADIAREGLRQPPVNPDLYNVIRAAIDDWHCSTSAHYVKDRPDLWDDGLARYIVTRLGWANRG